MELLAPHKLMDFTTIQYPKKGLFSLYKLDKIVRQQLGDRTFEDSDIPFWEALSNLNKGEVEYHNEGCLVEKVVASASIPIPFSAVNCSITSSKSHKGARQAHNRCEHKPG